MMARVSEALINPRLRTDKEMMKDLPENNAGMVWLKGIMSPHKRRTNPSPWRMTREDGHLAAGRATTGDCADLVEMLRGLELEQVVGSRARYRLTVCSAVQIN